jgi:hypothetical protein
MTIRVCDVETTGDAPPESDALFICMPMRV